uniref:Uncharacterized protein n=1 Tax=Candidatus Kentrum sp. DK TaxID=2126562 RepID=A0A450SRT3_9GAMM|nr:MAG: hypothetical protein BECKDK2373C_GA0170839_103811 [Candidatus Kentron sp. DK]VFJ56680.1 MAG: hypothetical protein BECKDK2373B_GA0170837_106023 [Candidatus Kentron sp. DK]
MRFAYPPYAGTFFIRWGDAAQHDRFVAILVGPKTRTKNSAHLAEPTENVTAYHLSCGRARLLPSLVSRHLRLGRSLALPNDSGNVSTW